MIILLETKDCILFKKNILTFINKKKQVLKEKFIQ